MAGEKRDEDRRARRSPHDEAAERPLSQHDPGDETDAERAAETVKQATPRGRDEPMVRERNEGG